MFKVPVEFTVSVGMICRISFEQLANGGLWISTQALILQISSGRSA